MNAPFSRTLQYTIGVSFNPYLYGSKEYLTTGGANLLDFTARTYDPSTLLFHAQDPNATDYTPLNTYLYCGSDPINRVDRNGCSTEAILEVGSRYRITGGNLYDDDLNIYSVIEKDGKYVRTGIIGVTPVITSFYNSDINEGKGAWAINSYIDPNDNSGLTFISKMTGKNTPEVIEYGIGGRGGHPFDFKLTNGTSEEIEGIDIYRGMPMGTDANGMTVYTSARDIGNMIAGYVVGTHGWSWYETRIAFDGYQSFQTHWKNFEFRTETEGISSQNAQRYGFLWGKRDTPFLQRLLNRATQFGGAKIALSLFNYYILR